MLYDGNSWYVKLEVESMNTLVVHIPTPPNFFVFSFMISYANTNPKFTSCVFKFLHINNKKVKTNIFVHEVNEKISRFVLKPELQGIK